MVREGWEEAFKQYAEEGEDPLVISCYCDGDTEF